MIGVAESSEEPLKNAGNNRELYLRLEDYLGQELKIRGYEVERIGYLKRLSYQRRQKGIFAVLAGGDREQIGYYDRVEVKLDGVWKVLNPGNEDNWEL